MLRRNLLEAIRMACNDQKEAPKYNQRKKKNYKIELTDAQIWELRRDFEAFESARTGPIEVKELQVAIKHLGLEPTEELISMVANQDPSGVIYFNDFLHVAAQEMKKENPTEELKKVFQMFDNDSTGKISLQNLQRVAKELGQNITNEELKEMIDEADQDGDGEVSWEEFQLVMRRPNPTQPVKNEFGFKTHALLVFTFDAVSTV